jgi:hypothetical protein
MAHVVAGPEPWWPPVLGKELADLSTQRDMTTGVDRVLSAAKDPLDPLWVKLILGLVPGDAGNA